MATDAMSWGLAVRQSKIVGVRYQAASREDIEDLACVVVRSGMRGVGRAIYVSNESNYESELHA
jgi:hypothetical protein